MQRAITGFFEDEHGDWVATLDCLHTQHVRHDPPFTSRPWVVTETGRDEHLGATLDCPLCDRAEMPAGLTRSRTAGPFDAETLPPALLRSHLVPDRTWGRLRVLEGVVEFTMETEPSVDRRMTTGDEQAIPPGVRHSLTVEPPILLAVDFLVAEER